MSRSSLHLHRAHKKVSRGGERERNSIARWRNFRLDVGEAPGRIQRADAVAHFSAIQRFSDFLRQQLQDVLAITIAQAGNLNGSNDLPFIRRNPGRGQLSLLQNRRNTRRVLCHHDRRPQQDHRSQKCRVRFQQKCPCGEALFDFDGRRLAVVVRPLAGRSHQIEPDIGNLFSLASHL